MAEHQVDIITKLVERGVFHLAEVVLSYLDAESLYSATRVSRSWRAIIREACLWKKLIEKRIASDPVWARVAKRRCLLPTGLDDTLHEKLYCKIVDGLRDLDHAWGVATYSEQRVQHHRVLSQTIQCNDDTLVIGSCVEGIRILDRKTLICMKTFTGQTSGVNRIQFNDQMIVCGLNNGDICIWDRNDPNGSKPSCFIKGEERKRVEDLKFHGDKMVSVYGRDVSRLIVWKINSPKDVRLDKRLYGHQEHVMCVDLDDKYIVSGSGLDIKLWDSKTYNCARTLVHGRALGDYEVGHSYLQGLHYRDGILAVGYIEAIKILDAESGVCLRTIIGARYPRFIEFDQRHLVVLDIGPDFTGFYSDKHSQLIWIYDLKAVLDEDVLDESLRGWSMEVPDKRSMVSEMRMTDFKLECWSSTCIMTTFNFREN